ncbi:MAG: RluA family pseudouridine synthase [Oscillospiraceae bacterium]
MEILYKDDRIVVCIKPAGVLSTDEPGGMPELIRQALGEPSAVIRSVHRLDRAVSGVMVYARTKRAAADLSEQIRAHRFHKEYLAVVHGLPPKREDTLRDWLHRDKIQRKSVLVPPETTDAQEAVLTYRLCETAGELSLLAVELFTGRTHQIRCQLAGHGMPLAGDRKYGHASEAGHIALLSHKIRFMHPRTGEEMNFEASIPHEFPWNAFFG